MDAGIGRRGLLAGMGASAASLATTRATAVTAKAATVIVNGELFDGHRGFPARQGVALSASGRVLEVGSYSALRRWIGSGTDVFDAEGATIMPGIHDGHMHPLGAAAASLNPTLGNASFTVTELQSTLQGFLDESADHEPDGWLQVTDWSPVGLLPTGTIADRSILDALSTSRPIYIQGSDFHNSLVNSRALALAGVDSTTPDPPGGQFVRDAAGNPTGLLKDNAQWIVAGAIPPPDPATLDAAYAAMARFLLSVGVTSFMDAAASPEALETYAGMLARGELSQRVVPALVVAPDLAQDPAAAVAYLEDLRSQYSGIPNLRMGTAKIFMDGVIEFPAQTAALIDPYLDENGKATDHRGDLYVGDQDLRAVLVAADRAHWQVHMHAIGDLAVRTALNGIESAWQDRRHSRRVDPRHTITHLELVHPDDYPRFARVGALASMQLQWAVRNVFTLDALEPFIGPERFDRLYPARSLEKAGAHLVAGSDWPVDPLNPFNQIATAVDRSDAFGPDSAPLNRSERLTRRRALSMATAGGAHQMWSRTGVIAKGSHADVIVLDRDLMRVPTAEIRQAQVRQTIVSGDVVYDADTAPARRTAQSRLATVGNGCAATDRHACCKH